MLQLKKIKDIFKRKSKKTFGRKLEKFLTEKGKTFLTKLKVVSYDDWKLKKEC